MSSRALPAGNSSRKFREVVGLVDHRPADGTVQPSLSGRCTFAALRVVPTDRAPVRSTPPRHRQLQVGQQLVGHAGGDEAITFVADVISRNARRMDVATRFGGDEFAVICSVASEDELLAYGRQLLETVRSSRFAPAEEAGIVVTISAILILVVEADVDEHVVLERAYMSVMYRAKRAGRNDVALESSQQEEAIRCLRSRFVMTASSVHR